MSMTPGSVTESPSQVFRSDTLIKYEESRYNDLENDFETDATFDQNFNPAYQCKMIHHRSGTLSDGEIEVHDKRSLPEDGNIGSQGSVKRQDSVGGKRRESDGKISRKLGRRPITSEPTSKRKAQNRAAQRAFRERKEKYLKDLETKVEDLERASESANHENSFLRAQIEKISLELREYQKRFFLDGAANRSPLIDTRAGYLSGRGFGINRPSDINFEYGFSKFGRQTCPPLTTNIGRNTVANESMPLNLFDNQISPRNQSIQYTDTETCARDLSHAPHVTNGMAMSDISGIFSNPQLESTDISPSFDLFDIDGFNAKSKSSSSHHARASFSSKNDNSSSELNTIYSSPPTSSNSQNSSSPSCRASSISTLQSPIQDEVTDLKLTMGEENTCISGRAGLEYCEGLDLACEDSNFSMPRVSSDLDIPLSHGSLELPPFHHGLDWLTQQSGNHFNPQLFENFRERQDGIIPGNVFHDGLFTDTFAMPVFHNVFSSAQNATFNKKNLLDLSDDKPSKEEKADHEDGKDQMNHEPVWDPATQTPSLLKDCDSDLESLCKDLQKKAKCSRGQEL